MPSTGGRAFAGTATRRHGSGASRSTSPATSTDRCRGALAARRSSTRPPTELPGPDAADRLDSSPALDSLRSLPERQRAIAALYYLDDLSVADISETLEIAEGTVRFHLSQARARLRAELDIDAGADRG